MRQVGLAASIEICGERGVTFETQIGKFGIECSPNASDETASVSRCANLRRKRPEQRAGAGVADDNAAFAHKLPVGIGQFSARK